MESKGDENVQTEDNKYFQKLSWNWHVRRWSSSGDGCSTAASEENFQDEEKKKISRADRHVLSQREKIKYQHRDDWSWKREGEKITSGWLKKRSNGHHSGSVKTLAREPEVWAPVPEGRRKWTSARCPLTPTVACRPWHTHPHTN